LTTSPLRSNVASLALEPAPLTASRAAIAMSGLSARTASIASSDWSFDWISVSVVWMSSTPLTCRFSTSPPKPFLAPSQRWLSPMFACSWMTQSSFFPPASFSFAPAPSPAIVSVWPTCVIAPSSW
jgi:hypothetical protein